MSAGSLILASLVLPLSRLDKISAISVLNSGEVSAATSSVCLFNQMRNRRISGAVYAPAAAFFGLEVSRRTSINEQTIFVPSIV